MNIFNKAPTSSPPIGRVHAFDLMRGFFLIVILLDHLAYYPSGFDLLSGRGMLYASAAEGFFLISGIVLGLVRGRKLIEQPFSKAAKLMLKRSLHLYIEACILTLLFTVIGWLYASNPGVKYGDISQSTPFWEIIWKTLTLQYNYGWADFLRYYAVFLAGGPIVLWLLRRGWWYVVAIVSAFIWTLYPLAPGGETWLEVSWQFVFYAGMIIGFYWPEITAFWRNFHTPKTRRNIKISLFALFALTYIASFVIVFGSRFFGSGPLSDINSALGQYFDKDRLAIGRIILGTIWFWALFVFVRRYEGWIIKKLGWLLTPLGTHSLYVYTIEAFIIFFAHLYIQPAQPLVETLPWYVNLPISIVAIFLVWFATKKEFLFKIIPR